MQWWDKPVRVMIGGSTIYNVGRIERAAELLLGEWPIETGPAHMAAQKAILEALENPASAGAATAARQAFEEAAREADILMEQ